MSSFEIFARPYGNVGFARIRIDSLRRNALFRVRRASSRGAPCGNRNARATQFERSNVRKRQCSGYAMVGKSRLCVYAESARLRLVLRIFPPAEVFLTRGSIVGGKYIYCNKKRGLLKMRVPFLPERALHAEGRDCAYSVCFFSMASRESFIRRGSRMKNVPCLLRRK